MELQSIEIKNTKGEVTGYRTQINDKDGKMLCYSGQRVLPSNDFDTKYVRHDPTSRKGCIHRDYIEGGWALIKKNIEGKGASYYSECLEEGCTVPMFFAGNQIANESAETEVMANGKLMNCADIEANKSYDFDGFTVTRTSMSASIGKGDGYTSITGVENDTSYLTSAQNPVADEINHYGGKLGEVGNYHYKAYDESNMPVAMDKIYNAILNPDLRSMIGKTDVVYATNSKDDTKAKNNSNNEGNMATIAPSTISGYKTNESMNDWWKDHIDNSGETGQITDNRSGNVAGNKKAYQYGHTVERQINHCSIRHFIFD